MLEPKTAPYIMLSYKEDKRHNYTVYRLDNYTVINAYDVVFKEKHLYFMVLEAEKRLIKY